MKNSQNVTGPVALRSNNSGQALIEYVLMLIITVSLVLALIAQVFKPFQEFVQSYMGDYVQCLLETGELPFASGDTPNAAKDAGCSAKFGAASWNKNPNVTGGTGGKGGDNSNSSASSSSSSSSSNSDSSSGSSGRSTYAGSSSRNGRSYFSSPRSAPKGVGDSGGSGKVIEIALDNKGGGFFKGSTGGGYTPPARKVRAVGMTGLTDDEKKKLAKKAEGNSKIVTVSDGRMPASKKSLVKKPQPKAEFEGEDEPMSIGNFIRFLFIAALVIALLLFIGGQALQMSKSFEK